MKKIIFLNQLICRNGKWAVDLEDLGDGVPSVTVTTVSSASGPGSTLMLLLLWFWHHASHSCVCSSVVSQHELWAVCFFLSRFLEFLSVSGRWCVTHTPLSPAQCRNVHKHTTHNVKLENERESEETPAQTTALRQRLPPITEPALGAKGSSSSQELYLFYIYV